MKGRIVKNIATLIFNHFILSLKNLPKRPIVILTTLNPYLITKPNTPSKVGNTIFFHFWHN